MPGTDELGEEGKKRGSRLTKTQARIKGTVRATPEILVGGCPSVT